METPYIPAQDETLRVHLYNAVPWDGPLGLWASGNEVAGMPLYAGTAGENPLGATLAVQRVSDYSGSWPSALVRQLALPLTAAAFLTVLLAVLHAPLALLVAAAGLALGCGFIRVTPALGRTCRRGGQTAGARLRCALFRDKNGRDRHFCLQSPGTGPPERTGRPQ